MTRPASPDPAQDRAGRTMPQRLAALLHVVRVLLGHGRRLVQTVPERAANVEFAALAGVCGTYVLPTILARLQRGILRAMALERYLLARADKGREIGFVCARERTSAKPAADEKKMVWIGKITVVLALIIGVVIAPFMGIDKKGGFEFIQEYTGFVSPGIFAMFILGFFWKKTTSSAALFATVGGFVFSIFFKFLPAFMNLAFLEPYGFAAKTDKGIYEIPFLDRMGFVFVICIVGMWLISTIGNKMGVKGKGLEIDRSMFKLSPAFTVGVLIVGGILTALYTIFW